MIMTIEAENIFDKIQHPFIKELLDKQGRNQCQCRENREGIQTETRRRSTWRWEGTFKDESRR